MHPNIFSLTTQFWTLKESGALAPWDRVKIRFRHCGRIL
jgi:hypothetical protein